MKKVISPDENLLTKSVFNYVEFSPIINCRFIISESESLDMKLKIYADKKMRKSILNNVLQGKLVIDVEGANVVLKPSSAKPVAIKTGVRGDDSEPILVQKVEINSKDINNFSLQPQGIQRTAKEQADYLFGQLIASVGGEEWIKEQTWTARGQDIIHNNNKGNVAYTRLDIMLNRCLRIYNQFNQEKAKSGSAE